MPAAIPNSLIQILMSHFKITTVINSAPFLQHEDTIQHYTTKQADIPFGLCQDTWSQAWRDCLVLCPPEKDDTQKYLRWTLCSMQHATGGDTPTVALIVTAQGQAEKQCHALLQHGSVIKLGELTPYQSTTETRTTRPRKCTLWVVPSHPQDVTTHQQIRSFLTHISLSDTNTRMTTDATIPYTIRNVSTEETVTTASRLYRLPLHPPARLQRILDAHKQPRTSPAPPSLPDRRAIPPMGQTVCTHSPSPTDTRIYKWL